MAAISPLPLCRMDGPLLRIEAFGRQWLLDYSADLEAAWANLSDLELADERIPYWMELWPSSLALGAFLERKKPGIAGRIAVDLGCGMGFCALAGQYLGASVIACDYTYAALQACRRNAELNRVPLRYVALDWRAPALAPHSIPCVWAADILYEQRAMEPVLDFLETVLAPDATAWIAEPGRAIFGYFVELAQSRRWKMTDAAAYKVPGIRAGEPASRVTIWQMHPTGGGRNG